jgi:hypothetical protein
MHLGAKANVGLNGAAALAHAMDLGLFYGMVLTEGDVGENVGGFDHAGSAETGETDVGGFRSDERHGKEASSGEREVRSEE